LQAHLLQQSGIAFRHTEDVQGGINHICQQGTLQAAECRFLVEKSMVMVYNKLLDFAGVTRKTRKSGF